MDRASISGQPARGLRVWDLPTRMFHWLLAVCVIGAIISANIGGNAMAWHVRFGSATLALLLFRVIWGFVGPRYARFSSFLPNPVAAWAQLRGRAPSRPGHSALAAWSVYAMLLAVGAQVATGLFANDGIMWDGPLRNWVSEATSNWLTGWHLRNRIVLIALIVLHIAAIAWYRLARRKHLTRAMITGDTVVTDAPVGPSGLNPPAARDDGWTRLGGLVVAALCGLSVWLLLR